MRGHVKTQTRKAAIASAVLQDMRGVASDPPPDAAQGQSAIPPTQPQGRFQRRLLGRYARTIPLAHRPQATYCVCDDRTKSAKARGWNASPVFPKKNEHTNILESSMRNLIVVAYDTEFKAEEVRLDFLKMQKSYLVSLEDAVIVEKKQDGKIKLHQMYNLTARGAVGGGFWGALIGLIFLNPLLGLVVGAGAGAVAGALSDVGINDAFMKKLAEKLTPGTSALFLLVDSTLTDKVLDELRGTGGTVLQTSLSTEDDAKLQAVLDGARADQEKAQQAAEDK